MKFAVLGYTRASFGDGGHKAYWDGWYSDRELAEDAARALLKQPEFTGMLFCVVSRTRCGAL